MSGSRDGEGIFLDDRAFAARASIVTFLSSWAALIREERRGTGPARRTPFHLTAFLIAHLDWLLDHPAGPDFTEELEQTSDAARRASAATPAMVLGPCVEDGCEGSLITTGSPAPAAAVRCTAGHQWPVHRWLELQRRLRPQHLRRA